MARDHHKVQPSESYFPAQNFAQRSHKLYPKLDQTQEDMSQIAKAAKSYAKHLEEEAQKTAAQEVITTRSWGSSRWNNHGNDKAFNQTDQASKEK